jgi:hypothetical protein
MFEQMRINTVRDQKRSSSVQTRRAVPAEREGKWQITDVKVARLILINMI